MYVRKLVAATVAMDGFFDDPGDRQQFCNAPDHMQMYARRGYSFRSVCRGKGR